MNRFFELLGAILEDLDPKLPKKIRDSVLGEVFFLTEICFVYMCFLSIFCKVCVFFNKVFLNLFCCSNIFFELKVFIFLKGLS